MKSGRLRVVIKAVSWRAIATLTTAGLVYLFTGELVLAAGIGVLEVSLKLLFYYIHERVWEIVPWGRADHPLSRLPVKRDLDPDDLETVRRKLEDLGYL
jgi:adenylylsulfate kinase